MRDFVEQLAEALSARPAEIQLSRARVIPSGRTWVLRPDEEEFRRAELGTNISTIYGVLWWIDQYDVALSELRELEEYEAIYTLNRTRAHLVTSYAAMSGDLAAAWQLGRNPPDQTAPYAEVVTATNCTEPAPAA
jgi:hypothetical protein